MARLQNPHNPFRDRHLLSQRKYAKIATEFELRLLNETDLDGTDALSDGENRAHFNLGSGCSWHQAKPTDR